MSAKQSALDQILVIFLPSDYPKWSERADLVIRARDELDQLLSRSNELDMLRKSPNKILKNCPACHYEYDTDICPECGWPRTAINSKKHGLDNLIEYAEDGGRFIWLDEAITELAQLRADLQASQERIAEQARQLDAARKTIERCAAYIGSMDHGENTKSYMMCDAWLAANPAPEAEPQP